MNPEIKPYPADLEISIAVSPGIDGEAFEEKPLSKQDLGNEDKQK